jgi:hypothetical protein
VEKAFEKSTSFHRFVSTLLSVVEARYYQCMGNLMPEQRADKNGRLVTRHVRSGASEPITAANLPKPSLSVAPLALTPSKQTRITNRIIDGTGFQQFRYLDGDSIIKKNLAYLARRSPKEFIALDEEIGHADPWLRCNWGATLDSISFAPKRPLTGEAEKDSLPDFLKMKVIVRLTAQLTKDDGIEPNGTALRGAALRGLIGKIRPNDYDTMRAALVATWILPRTANGSYFGAGFEPDNDSLEFIRANYEKVMDYRHALRTRGSIEPEVMEAIIATRTPSLSSGVL